VLRSNIGRLEDDFDKVDTFHSKMPKTAYGLRPFVDLFFA
jgi:hypothetical protein